MRVLLDENLPHDLISELGGHEVVTIQGLDWAGVKNGELLRRAAGQVDAFLTWIASSNMSTTSTLFLSASS